MILFRVDHNVRMRGPAPPTQAAVDKQPGRTDIAVRIERLVVRRGDAAVIDDVSAAFGRGIVTGLLGPSGSGKTTLMRAICGVQKVHSGSITVLGLAAGTAALRRRVAYVTQAPSVYTDLTVSENLRYFARIVGASDDKAEESIDGLGLSPYRGRLVGDLSGGERSRVSLAVALLADPELLVLDEPTVGLDPVLRRDLWARFHALASAGRTLLISTHVMDEAARCDELLLLRAGRLVATGSPAELLRQSGSDNVEDAFVALSEQS
ncbi:MAG: ABC transporter ATP-binding protein [Candidatus Dormibacteria bacterium]